MTLEPAARHLLDDVAAAGAPPLEALSVEEARAQTARAAAAFAPGPPAEVREVRDVGPGRLFDPTGEGHGPIVVELHGGGWVLGDLDQAEPFCRALAGACGRRVLSVDYRLAPEHPFPAALDDAYAAVEWAAAASGAPVVVCGESAGGNLAAAVCLLARERGGPDIALQVLVQPVLDARCAYGELGDGYLLTTSIMRWFAGHYLAGADPTDPLVSPLLAPDVSGLPPALVVTGEYDPLRDEGEAYAARLRDAGVEAVTSRYHGTLHGFVGMPAVFPDATRAAIEECGWAIRTRSPDG